MAPSLNRSELPLATGTATRPRRFCVLDASALIPYYLEEAAKSTRACERIRNIIDAVRHHHVDVHCFVPNIVVAEVFTALDRHCHSTWDRQINRKYGGNGRALDMRRYRSARDRFRRDIHNGALLYQHELNRYHILALDLISPIDKSRKFYRKKDARSMGASDLLIGAMSLHLAKVHGRPQVALITTDRRMKAIFDQVPAGLRPATVRSLGLANAAKALGFGEWTPDIYPHVIDIDKCADRDLTQFFGVWPPPTRKQRNRAPRA